MAGQKPTRAAFANHEEYIAALPASVQPLLERIREAVEREVPDAVRCLSYGVPSYRIDRVFFHVGAFKSHIGIYPPVKGGAELNRKLAPYRGPKGNLAFLLSEPLPIELVAEVARTLAAEHGRKGPEKTATRSSSSSSPR